MRKSLLLISVFLLNSVLLLSSDEDKTLFPIFKEEAIKRGYELPKPYGINFIFVNMKQNVDINSLNLTGNLSVGKLNLGELSNFISVKSTTAKTSNTNTLVKADLWVFPFLNLYGVFGKTKGNSSAIVDINLLNKPFLKNYNFTLKYDGITYGAGAVIAGGYKNFFSVVDFNYTTTKLDIIDGNISALIISPKIGYNFDFHNTRNSFWIGAMYQNISQTLKGDINNVITFPKNIRVPNGKFEVKESTSSPWNPSIGFRTEINKSLEFTSELSFGKRKSIIFSFGYRM